MDEARQQRMAASAGCRRVRSIQTRLAVTFSVAFAVVLILLELARMYGIPFTPYRGQLETYKREAIRGMNLAADLKEDRIRLWLDERLRDLEVFSFSRSQQGALRSLSRSIQVLRQKGLHGKALWQRVREQQEYQVVLDQLNVERQIYTAYQRGFVADAATGETIVSTRESDLGKDNRQESYFQRPLKQGGPYVSDAQLQGKLGFPVLYFSRFEMADTQTPEAIVVFEANADEMIRPILRAGDSLGARGEAMLVNCEAQNLCRLRHPLADGSHPLPLTRKLTGEPVVLAVSGKSGVIEALDYRGERVLAAYRWIRVASDVGWGLVVKRDQAELYDDLYRGLRYDLCTDFLGLVLVIGVTIVLARGLTGPLRVLSHTADAIAQGNRSVRAPVTTRDEVGALASQFNAMVDQLQTAEEARLRQERLVAIGQVTASVAHELRNPLGTIRLAFSLIARRLRGTMSELERPLETIDRSITRCDTIVGELLDYTRCRELNLKPLEVDRWLDGVLAEQDGVPGIEVHRDLGAGVTLCADEERLRRCLVNLVMNACQAMPSGGILTISSRVEENALCIDVRDTGCGISEEQRAKIFEPLYSTKSFGVGMGLPIVKQVVEQHGGQVRVESIPGHGTTFTMRLPTRPVENAASLG